MGEKLTALCRFRSTAEELTARSAHIRYSSKNRNIIVDKSSSSIDLPAPIVKVFYVNSDHNGARAGLAKAKRRGERKLTM